MFKFLLKIILPSKLFLYLKNKKSIYRTLIFVYKVYARDLFRYYKYSDIQKKGSESNAIGLIIQKYHVIEKGLTMPETKLGFGKDMIQSLCDDCRAYTIMYGQKDEQFNQAIAVLREYKEFHKNNNFDLDKGTLCVINELLEIVNNEEICEQKKFTKAEYFKNANANFLVFSNSRSSVRNYTQENIPMPKIEEVLNLARNTPSACNRQSWRTYIFTNKNSIDEILVKQGGNRGFGHLTNKLIVITSELGLFSGVRERNQAYIDGGMYAMNLLYSLHYHQIGACILNCSFTTENDDELRQLCNIKDSEVLIAMIACGILPDNFKVATSKRYAIENTNSIFDK